MENSVFFKLEVDIFSLILNIICLNKILKILLTILYNATERDFRNSFKLKSYGIKKNVNTYNKLVGSTSRSQIRGGKDP